MESMCGHTSLTCGRQVLWHFCCGKNNYSACFGDTASINQLVCSQPLKHWGIMRSAYAHCCLLLVSVRQENATLFILPSVFRIYNSHLVTCSAYFLLCFSFCIFLRAVIQRCVSSYKPTTCCQSSEHMKHRTLGKFPRVSLPTILEQQHLLKCWPQKVMLGFIFCLFVFLKNVHLTGKKLSVFLHSASNITINIV